MSELKKTRPQTQEELLGHATRAWKLLDEGIRRWDNEDELGMDLIAQGLRRLVCSGRGNGLLFRLCERTGVQEPSVRVTAPPAELPEKVARGLGSSFGYGSLPETDNGPPSDPIPISDLMGRLTIRYKEGRDIETFTWNELVSFYANKMGPMHSDEALPVIADKLTQYEVMGDRTFSHAVRSLGVIAAKATAGALIEAGVAVERPDYPKSSRGGGWIGAVQVFEGVVPDGLPDPNAGWTAAPTKERVAAPQGFGQRTSKSRKERRKERLKKRR